MCFLDHFQGLEDPRSSINRRHDLLDIVFLSVSAVLSGAQGWKDIKDFGDVKLDWLRQFRAFEHGIPVDDTIARVISALDPQAMMACFIDWVNELRALQGGECIAIDGKTFRRSHDGAKRKALHALSVWGSESGLVLAQMATEAHSNEITAAQQLIEMLELKGATVTLDAMHCQRQTAAHIIDAGGDYVLSLKSNQPALHEAVCDLFETYEAHGGLPEDAGCVEQVEAGHGRVEQRHYACLAAPQQLLDEAQHWPALRTLVRVTRTRHRKEHTSTETAYYISSLQPEPQTLARAIRAHWEVENKVHWVMDVSYGEDASRIRRQDGAHNIGLLRRMCLNLSRLHPKKDSMAAKLKAAAWNDDFRAQLIFGVND